MVKPCKLKIYQQDNIFCQYNDSLIDEFSPKMFSPRWWQQQNAIVGSAQGRGTTWFVEYNTQQWVLRHYYRGGFIGRLIKDSYIFQSIAKTRSAQELSLLVTMHQQGLPVPRPIGCKVVRSGLIYRADLLTQRIENAQDLVDILEKQVISAQLWQKIGKTIQQFHQQGIYHHDLNAHNILIDDHEKVWLIDFDRGQQKQPASSWQQANMARLLRSFNKERSKLVIFNWQAENWQSLLDGYQS
ncbi:MAG: 3-deoxy-D-manno-octulosonic acid kinase [Gammaproteobacteria bacterium]|nr:MAG: 3-deoxy-D-manno-octulosonic acid kinase [Gammaproteobacteria bacterium]